MTKTAALALCILLGSLRAYGWALVECGPEENKRWGELKKKMLAARPGSPLYVPHPFPRSDQQVVQNFLYQFHEIWPPAAELLKAEQPLALAIRKGDIRFEVLRVDNWSLTRCSPDEEKTFYFLLRIFDPSGIELARAAVSESGLWARSAYATAAEQTQPISQQLARLPSPEAAARGLRERFRIDGLSSPQYVTTTGGNLHCPATAPCLAVRSGESVYILRDQELFEIPGKGRRARFDTRAGALAEVSSRKLHEMADSLGPEERVVALGAEVYAVARRVKP